MKIWLSKNSTIPIREQIVTQIRLGIVTGDLPSGERLPSTRELAGRFQIHANTISSAYRELSEKGLIELKKGSGFYVCQTDQSNDGEELLDLLIGDFLKDAQAKGFSRNEIEDRLRRWLAAKMPQTIIVVESDKNLLAILIEEIKAATDFQIVGSSPREFQKKYRGTNAIVAARAAEKANLESVLPRGKECLYLVARSVANSLKDNARPQTDEMIAVVSGWEDFLLLAKTFLVAANIESDSILLRSTGAENWRKGLKNASLIICDVLTAKEFDGDERVRLFKIISDNSLDELIQRAA